MPARTIKVPNRRWHGEGDLELNFPAGWEVIPCLMNGHAEPELSDDQIKKALSDPSGTLPLRKLAGGKTHVAIIFDDISRPTPVATILRHVLEELHEAGIDDGAIRLICAAGCHGAHSYMDFEKKARQPHPRPLPCL